MNEVVNKKGNSDNDRSIDPKKVKYIIPPGLTDTFRSYLDHIKATQGQPILIVGDTGVGKLAFLHFFKKLYEERFKILKQDSKVIFADCAQFSGDFGDRNLSRSELFGHEKGAFSGAVDKKTGLVEKADKGVLILDEIGKLPHSVQAMLLTFIESGEFRKVGSTEIQKAKVQVVGATNSEKALLEDFRYRLIPFYIPPLYKRRQDILYYFAAKFPELLKTLNSGEVLALLAYNWPGNLREIDRVARLGIRHDLEAKWKKHKSLTAKAMFNLSRFSDQGRFALNGIFQEHIRAFIASFGGDMHFFDSLLIDYGISLNRIGPKTTYPFKDLDKSTITNMLFTSTIEGGKNLISRFEIMFVPTIRVFDIAYEGLCLFCGFFGRDAICEENLLGDALRKPLMPYMTPKKLKCQKSKLAQLMNAIDSYVKDVLNVDFFIEKLEKDGDLSELYLNFDYWGSAVGKNYQNNPDQPPDTDNAQNNFDMYAVTENQLLKNYYEGVLTKTSGIVKEAAKIAGVKETTFRAKLDRAGVSFRRSDKLEGNVNAN